MNESVKVVFVKLHWLLANGAKNTTLYVMIVNYTALQVESKEEEELKSRLLV